MQSREGGERKSMANRLSHVLGPGLKVRQVHLGLCRAVCVIQFSIDIYIALLYVQTGRPYLQLCWQSQVFFQTSLTRFSAVRQSTVARRALTKLIYNGNREKPASLCQVGGNF